MSVNGVRLTLIHLTRVHRGIILTDKTYIIKKDECLHACFGHFCPVSPSVSIMFEMSETGSQRACVRVRKGVS